MENVDKIGFKCTGLLSENLLVLLIVGCFFSSSSIHAATLELTAEYSPDITNPSKDEFTNTTPMSGYCKNWPHLNLCPPEGGVHSIDMGGITASLTSSVIKADSPPREGMYYKIPGAWRDVVVRNTLDNSSHIVRFRITNFSSRYNTHNSWTKEDHHRFKDKSFVNSPKPCGYTNVGVYTAKWYQWMWKWPESDTACYKIPKVDFEGEPYLINELSFGYLIKNPNPLSMNEGIYTGALNFTVGPGGDIDFGDSFTPSDSQLQINFTLKVEHELKVTPQAGATDVSLYPCYNDKDCTKQSEEKNWERWMVTNITPQKMSGISKFNISSSAGFSVHMQCSSDSSLTLDSCPMISEKSGTTVPVKARITLPESIKDSTGKKVINSPLYTEKNTSRFFTTSFGVDRQGQVEFYIEKKNVSEMLKSRPDSWSGSVTLIFDPSIY